MEIIIRAVKLQDAEGINALRVMDGVRENILGITSERISRSEDHLKNLGPNSHQYVAEVLDGDIKKIVGTIGLEVYPNPRMRHSGSIGLMVHKDYQGIGVGKKLMSAVVDLADNWLMLKRLELSVFTDNDRAIKLYKSFGFEIEGTKRCAVVRNGKYEDEYVMSRIK